MPGSPRPAAPRVERVRLDALLVERGLVGSREKAQALVLAGAVSADGRRAEKAGQLLARDAALAVEASDSFVSRGGVKLEHALNRFSIDVADRVCLDAGASTGGFTDCLLRRGARRVYAVDVGRGQLDWRLRNDPRVVVSERTNVRYLEQLPESMDLAVVDLSFISLRLVLLPIRRLVREGGPIVALVKPQFEAGRGQVGRGGVVRDREVHRRVLVDLWAWCAAHGFAPRDLTASPIRGPAGNVEFFLYLDAGIESRADEGDVPEASAAISRALAEAPVSPAGCAAR
ncbi:MAG: TlyA family RNA methyltransferase [Chloroflexi bacterium]|nr:TlyA family RNA methyltransferase [Chloroflexota bacterium]